ncbi:MULTISPECIES: DNA alkylation repair protein [unclassified Ruegeria]|uniref:DNA alkylation repair protein n=1 Tax=unclassified Ruegeria TaxID=2625375 RepID=UPI001487A009|nr:MULTISPECIES: DNA alkylation repair protein [unclassified Ruegeria]NOD74801.1 DNA alkylation repair protein [Ruegeria sp. HKCCD4332]NOD86752.1 DNA alkylation repair protein [Ruegeria sp. HKCCD4318]NOD92178.1 DNA alkylation repair protein [Ruegeria sp. HKCCD4884]NOE12307.1 DNA alkylation repair protein [Ruegeria sp. HKCCD4318-2]NOG09528.1 DNA alkylation repair protein [Ruegeria sp. HKCCD4315]
MSARLLDQIKAHADAERADQMASYHKVDRVYLGVANPVLNDLSKAWRTELDVAARVEVANGLWQTNIHEARVLAAKLLTQARIRPDDAVWDLLQSWLPDFDAWAIADHASTAMQKRLSANPDRLDEVEQWALSDHMWTRRAALVATLPWTKQNHPKPEDLQRRDRILSWAAGYVPDRDWFIQKAIAWWLRELSKHDPDRVIAFLEEYGNAMKPFAHREAGKYLKDQLA